MLLIIKEIKYLLLPPAVNLLLLLSGLLLLRRAPKTARACLALGVLSLYLLSIPPVSRLLLSGLEDIPPLPATLTHRGEQAIVILGGGRYAEAPEYGGDTVGSGTLARLRYGAFIARQSGLPVLVSGGRLREEALSEAELMQQVLAQSFNTQTTWKDTRSRNTAENALYSAEILRRAQIRHVYLITHARHMRRAVLMFEQMGIEVTPAPTAYLHPTMRATLAGQFIPKSAALSASSLALHEYLGLLWYRLRYGRQS